MFRADLEATPRGNFNFPYLAFDAARQHKRDDFKRALRRGRKHAYRGRGSFSITVRNPAFFLCPTPAGRKTRDFCPIFVHFILVQLRGRARFEVKPEVDLMLSG